MARGSKQETLVYYDSNIWIDRALAGGSENATNDLFDVLHPGRRVVVVSNLLEYEVYHKLRKKLTSEINYEKFRDDTEKVQKEVNMKIKKVFGDPLKILLQSKKAKRQNSKSDYAASIDNKVLEKMKNHTGLTKVISVCPKCECRVKQDFKNRCPNCEKQIEAMKKYSYHGLNGMDLKHAYIAQSLGVRDFHSRDKGFKDLINDKEFSFKIKNPDYDSPSKPRRIGG